MSSAGIVTIAVSLTVDEIDTVVVTMAAERFCGARGKISILGPLMTSYVIRSCLGVNFLF